MLEDCTIEQVDGITTIEFSRVATRDDARAVIDRLAEKNLYRLRLWDFSKFPFKFTMDEVRELAKYGQLKFLQRNRLAVVAPLDANYGMMRALEVYREQGALSIPRVFRRKQDAMDWLEREKASLNLAQGAPSKGPWRRIWAPPGRASLGGVGLGYS